ncbi:MAG: sigma-70 family RNA polymerase sigma factor [Syntrophales bacterium]|jgi:RNA polymerase sigma-70 factor (ECF subfamily)|nr:sigma-70 family RNA polymerase sigma factor [Syntrophales bacterium]
MGPDQEEEVILSVLDGKREAYALLVDAYRTQIFNLAYRMTGNYEDASDLAQETFIRAYQNLRQFDPGKRFFTWLYTIGLNLIRNHLKKRGREMSREAEARSSSEGGVDHGTQAEQDLIQAQEIRRLEICLQKLPDDLREAVVLRYYQDLSFEEIATISNASLSAVKMRVYRGLEQLKRLIN